MNSDMATLPALCRLFDGVAAADMDGLLACIGARVVSLARGEVLFMAGTKADRFGVVLSGALAVVSYDAQGRRSIIKRVGPMNVAAAAQAVSRSVFGVTVEAASDSEVLVIRSERALSPCSSSCGFHIRLVRNLTTILAEKTLELNDKIGILSHRTTADRLMAFLHVVAASRGMREFDIPFDRQALADYLCVDRCALSTEIGKLARAGAFTVRKNHFSLSR